jgi:hypothetical protein
VEYKKEQQGRFKSVLVDFNCEKPCGETIELLSNSAAFVDLGLTLQTWNVKEVAGTVLYTGSDGLSLLIQWYPGKNVELTLSGHFQFFFETTRASHPK